MVIRWCINYHLNLMLVIHMDESKLISGGYLITDNKIKVKHPKIIDIIEYGEYNYFNLVSLFTAKPYDFMVQLDDMGIDYVDMSNFDLFITRWSSDYDYNKDLNWLCDSNYYFQAYQYDEKTFLYDKDNDIYIDVFIFEQIAQYLKKINMIPEQTQYNPANKGARKFVIDHERRKQKRQQKLNKKQESYLANLISSLVWANTSGINYENILNLYAYQFFNGVSRLQKVKEYHNLMQGYYTGNIDLKNQDDIHWLSTINL